MKKILLPALLLGVVFISGCATQTYYLNQDDSTQATLKEEKKQHFFIRGIAQEDTLNAAEICGSADKVAKVSSRLSFTDVVLRILTWSLYTPRTAEVYCTGSA